MSTATKLARSGMAGILLGLTGALLLAVPAQADGRVTVSNERGTTQADLQYRTELSVQGSGFQVVRGGFGGVYVMFGWVRNPSGDSWRPSRGGLTGADYQYIPDSEDADAGAGYLRFIAFPGGSTADEANAVLSAAGGFTVELTVPGPVFESIDRSGQVARVDCREVQCGVITIGAHGVANARNETFTPITFGDVYDAATSEESDPDANPDAAGEPDTDPDTDPDTETDTDASSTTGRRGGQPAARSTLVTVDRTTAVAGHALAFTAQGFTPGEQVLAVLDAGTSVVGPLTAGASGEVAAAMPLPAELAPGTHELRLTGAASGAEVTERFPALPSPETSALEPVTGDAPDASNGPAMGLSAGLSVGLFVGAAAALFLLTLLRYLSTIRPWPRRSPRDPMEVVA